MKKRIVDIKKRRNLEVWMRRERKREGNEERVGEGNREERIRRKGREGEEKERKGQRKERERKGDEKIVEDISCIPMVPDSFRA